MGIVKPDGVYRWARDVGKAHGQDPDKYLKPPTPEANLPPLFAEEVINLIMQGQPAGVPAGRGECDGAHEEAHGVRERRRVRLPLADAGRDLQGVPHAAAPADRSRKRSSRRRWRPRTQFQGGRRAQGVPGPQGTAPINTGNPQLQKNELLDESLPSAGGGGNPATLQ
jgi:hypothetical protein